MDDPHPMPPSDEAAAWGIIAAARAIEAGRAQGLSREQIAHAAHEAAHAAAAAHDENQPIVGAIVRRPSHTSHLLPHHKRAKKPTHPIVVAQPELRVHVGHQHGGGGGHHGGHHGGHGHGHDFVFIEDEPEYELACPPGDVVMADGTCAPWPAASVGHGGGHHGGHGHGGHGHGFGGFGVIYEDIAPVVLACGPGQLLLADGTCFDPALFGVPVEPHAHTGQVFIFDEDGNVELPEGPSVHVEALDWGGILDDEVHVGAASTQSQTGLTGAAYVQHLGQTLDSQWQQVGNAGAQAVKDGKITAAQWGSFQGDYQAWETWYQQAVSADNTSLFGGYGYNGLWYNSDILNSYTSKLVGWYNTFQKADPSAVAANVQSLPGPSPDTTALGALTAAGQAVVTAIEYAVIAVAIGVGVWLLWPVLTAGAAKAAAAL